MIGKRVVLKETIGKAMQVYGTIIDVRETHFGVIFDVDWENGGYYSFDSDHRAFTGSAKKAEDLELVEEFVE